MKYNFYSLVEDLITAAARCCTVRVRPNVPLCISCRVRPRAAVGTAKERVLFIICCSPLPQRVPHVRLLPSILSFCVRVFLCCSYGGVREFCVRVFLCRTLRVRVFRYKVPSSMQKYIYLSPSSVCTSKAQSPLIYFLFHTCLLFDTPCEAFFRH